MSADCIIEHPSEPNRNWCTVCGVSLTRSQQQVLQHVQSAKHARTAQQPEKHRKTIQKKRQCKAELRQAAKHAAHVKVDQGSGHAGARAAAATVEDESKQASPASQQPHADAALPSNQWRCEVCARVIMAHTRASHEAGKDHRRKLMQHSSASEKPTTQGGAAVVPCPRPRQAASQVPSYAAATASPRPPLPPPPPAKLCPVCREPFSKKKDLDRHIRTATGAGHRRHRTELLYVDMPVTIAWTPDKSDDDASSNMCVSCGEAPARVRCPSCPNSIYCNRECQRDDWRWTHRDECAAIHSAEELAQRAAERAYEEEQDEAREIYREWYGYYDGNSGYSGGDD